MSIITNNPYQSPRLDAQSAALDATAGIDAMVAIQDANQKQETTISYSAWAGVLFGGTFGLAGSLVLALSLGVLLGWAEFLSILSLENAVIVLTAGSVSGVACGLLIGPFVGSLVANGRYRRTALFASIVLSAFAGGMIGLLGTQLVVLREAPPDAPARFAMMVGAAIGGMAGLLGGCQLGRGILAFGDKIETQSSD